MSVVAIERQVAAMQVGQRAVVPVVGVGVGQQQGVDGRPRRASTGEAGGELARAKTGVEQQAEAAGLQQTRVARAAARPAP